jgi:sigma-E factor negative regulatory protein RseB
VIVSLTPRDQHRYGFELHLDRETALPLRSLMLNDKGQLLERFQMTRLDTSVMPDDRDLQPRAIARRCSIRPRHQGETCEDWRSDWLPPGFELVSSSCAQRSKAKPRSQPDV